jgi:hypothetical protein
MLVKSHRARGAGAQFGLHWAPSLYVTISNPNGTLLLSCFRGLIALPLPKASSHRCHASRAPHNFFLLYCEQGTGGKKEREYIPHLYLCNFLDLVCLVSPKNNWWNHHYIRLGSSCLWRFRWWPWWGRHRYRYWFHGQKVILWLVGKGESPSLVLDNWWNIGTNYYAKCVDVKW